MSILSRVLIVTAVAMAAACDVPASATDLHPEDEPKIQQVFLFENFRDMNTNTIRRRAIVAFGEHAALSDELTHPTTTASTNEQTIRVVFDEILRGNNLEEVRCRLMPRTLENGLACQVPGGYSRVPVGATPDDIARCAVANDQLDASCTGPYAVCLNPDGIACGIEDTIPVGGGDGAPDDVRLIPGQVKLVCGDIEVPIDDATSYWQPAGNQLVPAGQTAQSSLGPALILKPINGRLPTNQTCRLVLAGDVVDKDGLQVCAPPGGDPTAACTAGDLSAFSFGTDQLRFTSSAPNEGETGVSTTLATIQTFWNAPITASSVNTTNVTISPAVPFTVALVNMTNITLTLTGPLAANTTYTVTFTGIQDSFGSALPGPLTLSFTTAP